MLREVTRLTQDLKESKILLEKMQTDEMMLWMEMRRVEKEWDKLSSMLSESLVGDDSGYGWQRATISETGSEATTFGKW